MHYLLISSWWLNCRFCLHFDSMVFNFISCLYRGQNNRVWDPKSVCLQKWKKICISLKTNIYFVKFVSLEFVTCYYCLVIWNILPFVYSNNGIFYITGRLIICLYLLSLSNSSVFEMFVNSLSSFCFII